MVTVTRLRAAVLYASFAIAIGATGITSAQVVLAPTTPVVGSSNPATAEPLVTRPSTKPCTVILYSNEAFNDYAPHPIAFTPPAACKGPWARVVLSLDFTVTAGRQFDRTASLFLGNANIYYGTTAEPRAALSPSWHVERDVTDLSAIFKTAQVGNAIVYNVVDGTYTGKIYGNATLQFYPANIFNPPADVADLVIPVSSTNGPYELDSPSNAVTTTVTLPRNLTRAYLDVISQSQGSDEFWYLGAPNDVAGELETSGGTAFRETEIFIDGRAAGIAPVSPWIYTGGIDPYLWEPITGVETLNFKPYRVDLTPFAGALSDGKPHTVSISVFNANNYFLATANLLLFQDHLRAETGGDVLENTLSAAPVPVVTENLTTTATGTTGTVTVGSRRSFKVRGYVNTGLLGRVETTVESTVNFNNSQTFNVASSGVPEIQNADQTSTVDSKTTTQWGILNQQVNRHWSFPLKLNYTFLQNTDGTYSQIVSANQVHDVNETTALNGFPVASADTIEQVNTSDTLIFTPSFSVQAVGPTTSSASYISRDSTGACWSRSLTSSNRVLTSVQDNTACKR